MVAVPFQPPFDWAATIAFLAPRAIPGVEIVEADCYQRSIRRGNGESAILEVRPGPDHLQTNTADPNVIARVRHLFDLDADAAAIDRHLATDPLLAPLIATRPGIRVPGAWDPFELSVRAILGQQVSVKGATTLAGRLAAAYGQQVDTKRVLFPLPEVLATADLTRIGLTRARAAAISGLAAAIARDPLLLVSGTVESLCLLPGIGPWTAEYIAMRALHVRDAFPHSDLGLLRAMQNGSRRPAPKELLERARAWQPYRAYAAMRLWLQR